MPETFAVVLVFVVSIIVYVAAKIQARNPVHHHPSVRREQLQSQHAWLEERLLRAERENWGPEMRHSIAEQLAATRRKLSEVETH